MREDAHLSDRRFLIKLSGELLGGPEGRGLDSNTVENIGSEIIKAYQMSNGLPIVIGGGNFFRGGQNTTWKMDRVIADQIGMIATAMNCMALYDWFLKRDIDVHLASSFPIGDFVPIYSTLDVRKKLKCGSMVLLAGGTGNPFFTTDTTACLKALELNIDLVIKATRVDGVFDSDPEVNDSAVKYQDISIQHAIDNKLKIMDNTAYTICQDNKISIRVLDISIKDNLCRAILGESVGSLLKP